jgi:uncharacterized damage-inducible protein DinB
MTTSTSLLANRFREVILNGRWIANTNFKEQLNNLNWELANKKVGSLNTIALLTFHIHYYISGVLKVLEGGSLDINDKYSFDLKSITSQKEWETLLTQMWKDTERFAELIEQIPEEQLNAIFVDEKYGTYLRNIEGMIEHSYYHLGQIVLIKKLLQ